MLARKRLASGFTLVEILIVVVILGILAAIVVPQFTNASQTAKASSLLSQLQSIRSQLELYQVQHNAVYPDLTTWGWSQMTETTDIDGSTNGSDFGPYLQKAPVNSFTNGKHVTTDISGDWKYDVSNGAIHAMLPAAIHAQIDKLGIPGGDVVSK